ncbi:response regulator [Variovorax rhizosphaerae]|uniref:Response regulator n=1 Tax=Variovorax rhizosphaerae TaxID=1836200 RepID=A0ABU8WVL7_9BURK
MKTAPSHQLTDAIFPVPEADSSQEKLARKLRILVVEDDVESLRLSQELLALMGHWSAGVSSAEAAIARFSEGAFDVLMLDVNLPALSGVDLAEKLCRLERLPVIFATGGAPPRAGSPGSIWLQKPYSIAQLEEATARAAGLLRCADA